MTRISWRHPDPKAWARVRLQVATRAQGRCECHGECGLHPPTMTKRADGLVWKTPRRCTERQGAAAVFAGGRIVLTTAHLNAKGGPCACDPLCCNLAHLRAMCQRCHLRYDHPRHMSNARRTRERKSGQARLFPREDHP